MARTRLQVVSWASLVMVDPKRSFLLWAKKIPGALHFFSHLGTGLPPLRDNRTTQSWIVSPGEANGIDTLKFVLTDLVPDDIIFFLLSIMVPFYSEFCMLKF